MIYKTNCQIEIQWNEHPLVNHQDYHILLVQDLKRSVTDLNLSVKDLKIAVNNNRSIRRIIIIMKYNKACRHQTCHLLNMTRNLKAIKWEDNILSHLTVKNNNRIIFSKMKWKQFHHLNFLLKIFKIYNLSQRKQMQKNMWRIIIFRQNRLLLPINRLIKMKTFSEMLIEKVHPLNLKFKT